MIIDFAIGKSLSVWTKSSNAPSKEAESEASESRMGLRSLILSLKKGCVILGSWALIQLMLPLRVLISPLWARTLNGCAKDHVGNVFVE